MITLLDQYAVAVPKGKITDPMKIDETYATDIYRWESEYSLQKIMEENSLKHYENEVLGTDDYVEISAEDLLFIYENIKSRDLANMENSLAAIIFFKSWISFFYTSSWYHNIIDYISIVSCFTQ